MQDTFGPTIVSGDGDSVGTPIKFTPCDRATRIAAEYRYICDRFGVEDIHWERQIHFTRPGFISDWGMKLADGTTRNVYFDSSVSLDFE